MENREKHRELGNFCDMKQKHIQSVVLLQLAFFSLSSCVYSTLYLEGDNKELCSQQSIRAGQVQRLGEKKLDRTQGEQTGVQGFVHHEGLAIENAQILVISTEDTYPRLEFNGASNSEGFFQIRVTQPGEYQLSIYEPGFFPAFLHRIFLVSGSSTIVRGCLKKNKEDQS